MNQFAAQAPSPRASPVAVRMPRNQGDAMPRPATAEAIPAPARLPENERRLLVQAPGLGPLFVQRLDEVGICSLPHLIQLGADEVIDRLCAMLGTPSIANRRRALRRFIATVGTTATS